MLVDHHAHWLPEPLLALLAQRDTPPLARRDGDGWVFTALRRPRPLMPQAVNLDLRSLQLERLGIDRQLLSLSPLWAIDRLAPASGLPLLQAFNDATARAVAAGTRFGGLAAVPADDVAAACDELRRTHAIGLEGVVLSAADFATRAGAERWAPLLALADTRGLRVFVHPGGDVQISAGDAAPWHRPIGLDPQHQLGSAMLTLCQSGVLDPFRRLRLQFANGGGSFPWALERLQRLAEDTPALDATRRRALRQVVVDTASLGPVAIGGLRRLLGDEAVVFGSDTPVFDAARAVADWRAAAAIDPFDG